MYKFVAFISVLVRQFMLPNPFEQLPAVYPFDLYGLETTVVPFFLNLMAEPLLHAITFTLVSIYYTRRQDSPVKGSLLYLLFYIVHVAILAIIAHFQFSGLAIFIVLSVYILLHAAFVIVKIFILNKFDKF